MATVTEMSRTERHTREGLEVVRTFHVNPYSYLPTVLSALLGEIKLDGTGYGRTLPARDPVYPYCRCQEANVEPVEVLSTGVSTTNLAVLSEANYSATAKVVATYRPLENEDTDDNNNELELATENFDFKYVSQQSPAQWWIFPDDANNVPLPQEGQQFTKTFPIIDYTLTRNYVVFLPTLSISKLANRVNRNDFSFMRRVRGSSTSALRRWPAETLRYEGANVSRRMTNKGFPYYTVAHKFSIFPLYDLCGDTVFTEHQSVEGPVLLPNPNATQRNFVGWNRLFRHKYGFWMRPKLQAVEGLVAAQNETIYLYDSDVTQTIKGQTVSGFNLLFNRYAS